MSVTVERLCEHALILRLYRGPPWVNGVRQAFALSFAVVTGIEPEVKALQAQGFWLSPEERRAVGAAIADECSGAVWANWELADGSRHRVLLRRPKNDDDVPCARHVR